MKKQKVKISDYRFHVLQIEPLLACNMRCTFCAYPIIENKGDRLHADEVYKIVDSVDHTDKKLKYICFSQYNEPLLDERIFDFITYAKDKHFKVLIITNALLFDSEKVQNKLFDSEPTIIKISLQSLSREMFQATRGTNYPYDRYKTNIINFLRSAVARKTSIEIVLDIACNFLSKKEINKRKLIGIEHGESTIPDNINNFQNNFRDFLAEIRKSNFCFDHNEADIANFLQSAEKDYTMQKGFLLAPNISIKVKQFIYGRRISDFFPVLVPRICNTNILSVLSNGSVAPCCLAYGDLLSLGNIKKKSLREILISNKDLLENIRTGKSMHHTCRKCQGAPTRRGAVYMSMRNLIGI